MSVSVVCAVISTIVTTQKYASKHSINKMKICDTASRKGKSRFLCASISNPGYRLDPLKRAFKKCNGWA